MVDRANNNVLGVFEIQFMEYGHNVINRCCAQHILSKTN